MKRYLAILTEAERAHAMSGLGYVFENSGIGGDHTAAEGGRYGRAAVAIGKAMEREIDRDASALAAVLAMAIEDSCSCSDDQRARGKHAIDCRVQRERANLDRVVELQALLAGARGGE